MRLAKRAGTDGERVAAEAAAKRLADANGITLESIDYQHETAKDVVMDDDRVRDTGRSFGREDTSSVRAGFLAAQKVNLSRPCESNWRTTGQVGHTLQLEVRNGK